ncbi:hypothetical protein QMO40_00375 [Mannheimia bovis]|uniref:hypothetical protein n=1 Tax=Mannheimia bovis TaxID=2770636 RepID=UPI0024B6AB16|nr:hypothetical protein [Mannheimia bovis]WHP47169.1 hypothetical protein QMO40_00375 [Mannheimia bovis]
MTQEEIDRLQAENLQLKEQLREQSKADMQDYTAKLCSLGILAPVARDKAVELLNYAEAYDYGETLDFNEGESLTSKVKAFLEAQPKIIHFGEYATPERAFDGGTKHTETADYADNVPLEVIELDKQIRAYMQTQGVDYRTAFKMVTQGAN